MALRLAGTVWSSLDCDLDAMGKAWSLDAVLLKYGVLIGQILLVSNGAFLCSRNSYFDIWPYIGDLDTIGTIPTNLERIFFQQLSVLIFFCQQNCLSVGVWPGLPFFLFCFGYAFAGSQLRANSKMTARHCLISCLIMSSLHRDNGSE